MSEPVRLVLPYEGTDHGLVVEHTPCDASIPPTRPWRPTRCRKMCGNFAEKLSRRDQNLERPIAAKTHSSSKYKCDVYVLFLFLKQFVTSRTLAIQINIHYERSSGSIWWVLNFNFRDICCSQATILLVIFQLSKAV